LVHGILQEDLCPGGSALCHLTDNLQRYDADGLAFDAAFYVENLVGVTACSGDTIMADYDAEDCSYNIVNQPQARDANSIINLYDADGCNTGTNSLSGLSGVTTSHLVIGNGINFLAISIDGAASGDSGCCQPSGTNESGYLMSAGFSVSDSSGCVTGDLTHTGTDLMHGIEFGGGIKVADSGDCGIIIGIDMSGITTDDWLDADACELFHLHAGSLTGHADVTKFWRQGNSCGLVHDDAGHVVGYVDTGGSNIVTYNSHPAPSSPTFY